MIRKLSRKFRLTRFLTLIRLLIRPPIRRKKLSGKNDKLICEILKPIKDDSTTLWAPLQVYWSLVERTAGLVDSYEDVFFKGDKMEKGASVSGIDAVVGYREISATNKRFFSIDSKRDGKSSLTASIDIPSASEKIDMKITVDLVEGQCVPKTVTGADSQAVKLVDIRQGFFGQVNSVTIK